MQAMNLHPAQQDILLNLLNVQPGKAQGMSKMPQDEMSFSSMLERADKTYSTEGKNTQTIQESSPKTEAPVKKEHEPREDESVRSKHAEEHAERADSGSDVKNDGKADAFDVEKADDEIGKFMSQGENNLSEEIALADQEHACLTMPDTDVVPEDGTENASLKTPSLDAVDAEILEKENQASAAALASRIDTKPVVRTGEAAETEKAAFEDVKDADLSSEKKSAKKNVLNDGREAAELVKADAAPQAEQMLPDAGEAALAAVHAGAGSVSGNESKIEIIDERTEAEPAGLTMNTTTTLNADNSSAEMVMTLPVQAAGSDANGSLEAGYTKADFSQMLNSSVAAAKDDFVKTGSIILQDNKKGSINLILHPEELGNVKVKLELSDNQITGKIVVASKEAYEAFRQNLDDLRNAFVASGFDACGFDLAWAGAGDSNGSQGQNSADNGSGNQFGLQYFGNTYEENIPDAVPEYYAGNTHINLVA